MNWFTKLEKSIAGKLYKAFTDAKSLAEHAGDEVEKAEAALEEAKQKAADLSKAAHEAALAAVAKAQAETAALLEEAKAAEARALFHAGRVSPEPVQLEPTLDFPPVAPAPVDTPPTQ